MACADRGKTLLDLPSPILREIFTHLVSPNTELRLEFTITRKVTLRLRTVCKYFDWLIQDAFESRIPVGNILDPNRQAGNAGIERELAAKSFIHQVVTGQPREAISKMALILIGTVVHLKKCRGKGRLKNETKPKDLSAIQKLGPRLADNLKTLDFSKPIIYDQAFIENLSKFYCCGTFPPMNHQDLLVPWCYYREDTLITAAALGHFSIIRKLLRDEPQIEALVVLLGLLVNASLVEDDELEDFKRLQ